MFRVIIAGGNDFTDYNLLCTYVDKMLSNTKDKIEIVCGVQEGAGLLGKKYAEERGYKISLIAANKESDEKVARYRQNIKMVDHADALVAFWDGQSELTTHLINIAAMYQLPTRIKQYGAAPSLRAGT